MTSRTTVGRFLFIFLLGRVLWMTTGLGVEASSADVVSAARSQLGVTTSYDPAYVAIKYPAGDVPLQTGVCADVVVRAYRAVGYDLQKLVHEDMEANFSVYPQEWGLTKPDSNIDHRRVANLMTFFKRHHAALNVRHGSGDYLPGDIVAWDLGNGLLHIGIVSDRSTPAGVPLMIHNIGQGVKEEDVLFRFQIIGHYRFPIAVTSTPSA